LPVAAANQNLLVVNRRQLWWFLLLAIILTVLSMFVIDQPVAAFVQRTGGRESKVLQEGTHWLEIASGFPITRYFLAYLLLGAAALLFIAKSTRTAAWMLLFIGSTHLVTRLIVGLLKPIFDRQRPFEVLSAIASHRDSFPSGHSAHFWGLFLPLMFLFPRYRLPLLIVPVFITIARVGVNDHWCSDVIASAGLAALFTLVFIWLFRMQRGEPAEAPSPGD
jgi:membrane-associated phospholipid phosphatase